MQKSQAFFLGFLYKFSIKFSGMFTKIPKTVAPTKVQSRISPEIPLKTTLKTPQQIFPRNFFEESSRSTWKDSFQMFSRKILKFPDDSNRNSYDESSRSFFKNSTGVCWRLPLQFLKGTQRVLWVSLKDSSQSSWDSYLRFPQRSFPDISSFFFSWIFSIIFSRNSPEASHWVNEGNLKKFRSTLFFVPSFPSEAKIHISCVV